MNNVGIAKPCVAESAIGGAAVGAEIFHACFRDEVEAFVGSDSGTDCAVHKDPKK